MPIQLNIGQMTKKMSVIDKAKLIVADAHLYSQTHGQKTLLTSYEQQKLYEDARKNNEGYYLNLVTDCLKIATLILIDLDRNFLIFTGMLLDLERTIQACFIKGNAEDILRKVIYDFVKEKYKDNQSQDVEQKIDKEANKIFEESGFHKGILGNYDYFSPPLREHSYFDPSVGNVFGLPNKVIIQGFMRVIEALRKYKKTKKELEYIIGKARVNLLSEKQQTEVDYDEALVTDFINLKGMLSMLKIYLKLHVMILPEEKEANDFMTVLRDINKATDLTEAEINQCEERVESYLKD